MPQQENAPWRKSSYSGGNGNCVEVSWPAARVAVRDSKNATGPALDFAPAQWRGFLRGCDGGFDDGGAGR
ncbi:MAG TPA: DUF397 domain-containing protein [Umezawaea sp.]|nr:DUF397 domain-containing protein [Umezawaea sp.]